MLASSSGYSGWDTVSVEQGEPSWSGRGRIYGAAAGQGPEQGPRAAASICTTATAVGRVTPVGQLPAPPPVAANKQKAIMADALCSSLLLAAYGSSGGCPTKPPAASPAATPPIAHRRPVCPTPCRMPVPWRSAVLLLLLAAAVTGSAAGRQLSASTALRAEAPKAGNRTVSVSAAPVAAIVNGAQGCFWFPSGWIAAALHLCLLAVASAAVVHVPP